MTSAVVFRVDSIIEFDGGTWTDAPCPGAELAVIHTARALAARGDLDVHVLCRARRPGLHDGVRYHRLEEGADVLARAGVVVHVRDYWQGEFLHGPVEARHVLWLHDTAREILSLGRQSTAATLATQLRRYDALVFVSAWHAAEVLAAAGLDRDAAPVAVFHHPLPPAIQGSLAGERVPLRLMHTAHPRKALVPLLRAWPRIARGCSGAELVLCGHPAIYQEETAWFHRQRATLSEIVADVLGRPDPRVHLMPRSLAQRDLVAEVARATLLLHPDTSVETGATTVLEAMAVGTVPVVSDLGCLPELCAGRGVITPYGPRFEERFADDVLALLADDERRRHLARAGQAHTQRLVDPVHVGERWAVLLARCAQAPARPRTPADSQPRQPTGPRPAYRVVAIDADGAIGEAAWRRFLDRSDHAWFTHTRDWYLHAERDGAGVCARWAAVLDASGELAALVPAATGTAEPSVLVSGLREPSGPCLRSDLGPAARQHVVELVTDTLEQTARTAGADQILVKLPAVDRAGLAPAEPALMPGALLRGYGASDAMQFVATASTATWAAISPRVRTQIRQAQRVCEVIPARDAGTLTQALKLYELQAERRGAVRFTAQQLLALSRSTLVRMHVLLARVHGRAAGFAIGFQYGAGAALYAWDVEHWARPTQVAKLLVHTALGHLLAAGAGAVEYGGAMSPDGPYRGLTEFYRRLGGHLSAGLHLYRRLPPAPAQDVIYAVR